MLVLHLQVEKYGIPQNRLQGEKQTPLISCLKNLHGSTTNPISHSCAVTQLLSLFLNLPPALLSYLLWEFLLSICQVSLAYYTPAAAFNSWPFVSPFSFSFRFWFPCPHFLLFYITYFSWQPIFLHISHMTASMQLSSTLRSPPFALLIPYLEILTPFFHLPPKGPSSHYGLASPFCPYMPSASPPPQNLLRPRWTNCITGSLYTLLPHISI